MAGNGVAPTGVVCDDRPAVRRALAALLQRCGFPLAEQVGSFPELRSFVVGTLPSVAVLTLPVAGLSGLAAVRELRGLAPSCELVLLSPFGSLEVAAREAGAYALVAEDDPQALIAVLTTLAHRTVNTVDLSVTLPPARSYGEGADTALPSIVC